MKRPWLFMIGVNLIVALFFAYSALVPQAATKTMLLPGLTTHGHYQIEMRCDLCHTEGNGIRKEACADCHKQELQRAKDTHAASKFNDPTNAERLSILDAQNCITCHREHVAEQTLDMGLTMPSDYCYHCHQETLETRPSHADFAFDSCATAGCHNYHDNLALYENFLSKHGQESDLLLSPQVFTRTVASYNADHSLKTKDADYPNIALVESKVLADWESTAHALAGVNCSGCHQSASQTSESSTQSIQQKWSDSVELSICESCHEPQVESFTAGRHGMRLAYDLPAMTPGDSRLEMHQGSEHRQLDCMACHQDHRFDTQYAAVEACLNCHDDSHSRAYQSTSHFDLFQQEQEGAISDGNGVSCATCHMPRLFDESDNVWVQHNQNSNLRPNEKMIREVCMNCHGLTFSIDALADPDLLDRCYGSPPQTHVISVDLAVNRFTEKEAARKARLQKRGSEKNDAQ